MKFKLFMLALFSGSFGVIASYAQVDIDKPINLSGGSGERAITNLELPVNGTDAVNKDYVDSLVSAVGGGFVHYIGEIFGGGVVVDLYRDSQGAEHGRIVSMVVNNASGTWSNITSTLIGSAAQSLYDGVSNSAAIMGQAGHTASAAKICDDYSGGGFNDWYLPAAGEFAVMWDNMSRIRIALIVAGGTSLVGDYWTSTEATSTHPWRYSFSDGGTISSGHGKHENSTTRCIRAF